ncbi:MAG: hypothetical protein PF448_08725 [Bacteroidales bacterium]|jgi:hypothetical protein|nr:hypothetical protein [Bacteroidales bacterium]
MSTIKRIEKMVVMPKASQRANLSDPLAQRFNDVKLDLSAPGRIKFELDNTGDTVNDKYYLMFDADGFCAAQDADAKDAETPEYIGMAAAAAINKFLEHSNLFIGDIIAQAKSASQFQHPLVVMAYGIDGIGKSAKVYLEDAVSGSQYDKTIQKYSGGIAITPQTGVMIKVNAGENLSLTMKLSATWTL